jgi:hypothetical protein
MTIKLPTLAEVKAARFKRAWRNRRLVGTMSMAVEPLARGGISLTYSRGKNDAE